MEYLSAVPYKQEIVVFVSVFIFLQILQPLCGKKNWIHDSFYFRQMVILVLSVYFTGVAHYTLLHRDVSAGMKYELSLFWSYRYVMENSSIEFFKEVLYNVLLLLPMGLLIPLYMKPFQKLRFTFLAGLLISCFIEVSQLIFYLGLFEFDDIFNNTLGAYLGYSIYYCAACTRNKNRKKCWYLKLGGLLLIDACVIGYFYGLWKAIV
ncbi:MAG: VanZ family protein [Lachnospiraceae bacterium]|nr:VanZ family protein [Lachnospiraceae bacterium]